MGRGATTRGRKPMGSHTHTGGGYSRARTHRKGARGLRGILPVSDTAGGVTDWHTLRDGGRDSNGGNV
jgi:hypothetical protein